VIVSFWRFLLIWPKAISISLKGNFGEAASERSSDLLSARKGAGFVSIHDRPANARGMSSSDPLRVRRRPE
jgi:hypothetical protein